MSGELLQEIQALQFTSKSKAEALTRTFITDTFSLDVQSVELRPSAVSLNSFNGFLQLTDGRRLFFKTHTESDNVVTEFYNAEMLAGAGYPVIQPLHSSVEAGKQLLIYEVIDDPSVFDKAWEIETGLAEAKSSAELTKAQHKTDDQLLQIYLNTLQWQTAQDAAQAPVHQLFYHRLVGGRLARFYGGLPGSGGADTVITLPDGQHSMQQIRQVTWTINGQEYAETLDEVISRSILLLNPDQPGASIAGHGDAHNGNVFYRARTGDMLYFDPAFAGRHHPLLDLTKPLFHNVFAMWMYFPEMKRLQTTISLHFEGNHIHVEHDYSLHGIREMFLNSKMERVAAPILRHLRNKGWLREDWRPYLKAALFCCPFLTMNLADQAKFPPEIALLGLAMSVEMGSESSGIRSFIDRALDSITDRIG